MSTSDFVHDENKERLARTSRRVRSKATSIPCSSRGRSPDTQPAPANPRKSRVERPALAAPQIPAYSRSARKRQDPACHAAVAGRVPSLPLENTLQMSILACLFWRNRPPAFDGSMRSSRTRVRTPSGQRVKPCKSPCSASLSGFQGTSCPPGPAPSRAIRPRNLDGEKVVTQEGEGRPS